MNTSWNKNWLAYISVLLFIVLQFFLLAGIVLATRISSDSVLEGHAEEVMKHVVSNVTFQTRSLLEPAEKAVSLSMDLIESEQLDILNDFVVERYFLSQLKIHPQFDGMYIGRKDGSFVFVNRDDTFKSFNGTQSVYRTQMIKTKPYKSVRISYRSTDNSLLNSSYNTDDFDQSSLDSHIQTEKLQLAVKNNQSFVWSEPYIFHTLNKPGITVATPLNDSNSGIDILGIDIDLTDLSHYLETVANDKNDSSAFLKTKDNTLVAFPELESYLQEKEPESLPHLNNLQDTVSDSFMAVANFVSKNKDSKLLGKAESSIEVLDFKIEDTSYIGTLQPISVVENQEWLLGIHAPKEGYTNVIMNRYNQSMWQILALGLLFSIVSIPVCYWITRPMRHLHQRATTDDLTKLYDRNEFIKQSQRLKSKAERLNKKVLFVMMDLDNFKPVNDSYGHQVGDEVLILIAKRIKESIKDHDICARFGGDEFALCLYDINPDDVQTILERIRKSTESNGLRSSQGFHQIGVTAGAMISKNQLTPEALLAYADAALVKGKITRKGHSYFSDGKPQNGTGLIMQEKLVQNHTDFGLMGQASTDKQGVSKQSVSKQEKDATSNKVASINL